MNDKMFLRSFYLAQLIVAFICLQPASLRAQHIHVNAGATSTEQGAALFIKNANLYETNALYDVYLTFTNAGSFANLYQGAGATFASLASTSDNGGPEGGHAAEGAFLQLQFISMNGPAGGTFGVWMQELGNPSVSHPLFALPVGTSNGTNLLALSESDGSPGIDPYGHIHGRTFTATKPGLYILGCRVLDTSTNGTFGAPIHTPSPIYFFYFQAGLTVSTWEKSGNTCNVTFGTTAGKTYFVESTSSLTTSNWSTIAGPYSGDNHLKTATTNSPASQLYFRIRSN